MPEKLSIKKYQKHSDELISMAESVLDLYGAANTMCPV